MGLRQRWIRNTILLVIIAVIIAAGVFTLVIRNYYYATARAGLEAKVKTATDFFSNYVAKSYAEFYDSAYRYTESFKDADKLELQFIDPDGWLMISSSGVTAGTTANSPDVWDSIASMQIQSWVGDRELTGERIMAVSAPVIYSGDRVVGVMRYLTSLDKLDGRVWRLSLLVFGVGALVVLMIVGMNLIYIEGVIVPVGEITKVSRRIADGSYGIIIEGEYLDDIGEMVKSINEMSQKIAQAEKVQSEFMSSVSHELRTPLTAIIGWSETIAYNDDLDDDTRRGLGIILKEGRRLTKMVEELLEFTRMTDGRFTLNITKIDVVAELEESISTYDQLLISSGMELDYEPYDGEIPQIPGDANRLKQVFSNVFDNAAKYGRDGKRISVSIKPENNFVVIRIRDYGAGIPEDELPNVKKKFFKGKNARERGSGIGLAVCDEIVRFHGGRLDLSNAPGGGAMATIRLPMKSSVTSEDDAATERRV
jgi:signal transduction histidine kinase